MACRLLRNTPLVTQVFTVKILKVMAVDSVTVASQTKARVTVTSRFFGIVSAWLHFKCCRNALDGPVLHWHYKLLCICLILLKPSVKF